MRARITAAAVMVAMGASVLLPALPAGAAPDEASDIAPDPGVVLLGEARDVRMDMYRAARSKSCTVPPYEDCEPPDAAALDLNSSDILAAARAQRDAQLADEDVPDKQIDSVNYGVKPASVAKLVARVQDIRVKLRTFDRGLAEGELDKAQRDDARIQLGRISRQLEVAELEMTKLRTKFDKADAKQRASGSLTGGANQKRTALVNEFNRALLAAFAAEKELATEYARIAAPVIEEAQLDLEVADVPTGEFATELFNGTAPADEYGSAFVDSIGVDPNEFAFTTPDEPEDGADGGPAPGPTTATTAKPVTATTKPTTATTKPPVAPAAFDIAGATANMKKQTADAATVKAAADLALYKISLLRLDATAKPSEASWLAWGAAADPTKAEFDRLRAQLTTIEGNMSAIQKSYEAALANKTQAAPNTDFVNASKAAYAGAGAAEGVMTKLWEQYLAAKPMSDELKRQGKIR